MVGRLCFAFCPGGNGAGKDPIADPGIGRCAFLGRHLTFLAQAARNPYGNARQIMTDCVIKSNQPAGGHLWVEFRTSEIHGMGGYARTRIPAGLEIIEYVGERISKAESLRRCELNNPFVFGLDETHDLDGTVDWNLARFLNHSCAPNCEAIEDEGRIWIVALRQIEVGKELTFNYGYSLDDYQEHPCGCGADRCVGFMVAEEFHPLVIRRNEIRRTAREMVPRA